MSVLVVSFSGSWNPVNEEVRKSPNVKVVYVDTSVNSLRHASADLKFQVGRGKGLGGLAFQGYMDLKLQEDYLLQIQNEIVLNLGIPEMCIELIGAEPASSSLVTGLAFTRMMKENPAFQNMVIMPLIVLDPSKRTTEEQAFKTLSGIEYLSELSDIPVIYNLVRRGIASNTDPYLIQDMEIARIITDLSSNNPPRIKKEREEIWKELGFDEFGSPPIKEDEPRLSVSGKLIDFRSDLTTLLPDRHGDKFAVLSNFHPRREVKTAYELIDLAKSNVTAKLNYPITGEIGVMASLNNIQYFSDMSPVVKSEVNRGALCRPFTHFPEIHGPRGALIGFFGIEYVNIPDLVDLFEKAKVYAERKEDELIPSLFERTVEEMAKEKTRRRMEMRMEEFKKNLRRVLALDYKRKREEIKESILESLDEGLRGKVKDILERRSSNNLSSIYEREIGPNPFRVIDEVIFW